MRSPARTHLLRLLFCFAPAIAWIAAAAEQDPAGSVPPSRPATTAVAEYHFAAAPNGLVEDRSGFSDPLPLRIDKPQATTVRGGKFAITAPVVIASDGPASKVIAAAKRSQEIAIELWLKPQDAQQSGPARIVSLSLDTSQRNLTIGQDRGQFDVRLRTTATDLNGMPSTATPPNSVSTALTHFVCSHAADGTTILYLDGKPVTTRQIPGGFDNWNDAYPLVIGNELTADRPWHGELHGLTIHDRALTADEVAERFRKGVPNAVDYESQLPAAHTATVDFVRDIQPILKQHCYECHAADQEDGGVNLGIRRRALQGGHNGPVFVMGQSAQSPLIHLVAAIDDTRVMPPDSDGLSDDEIGLLRAWIDQGLPWPESAEVADPREEKAHGHWAFQPLRQVTPPEVADAAWPQTEIDRFVLAKLEAEGLRPQPPATARQLIRRLHFDLTGLPPQPEQIEAFLAASRDDPQAATLALVEKLIASPQYGERWARHWLDVARYADSDGQESDRDRPTAYPYRDFVIRALNEDLPYDQFIRWQLAGDEYEPQNPDAVAATGFLAAGPFAALPDRLMEDERLRNRYNELDDIMSTVGSGLLGLTLGCVRCHDHKYDAIPARDYYSLLSAFHGGERAEVPLGETADKVLGYRDLGPQPSPTWLFQRGNYYDRDQPVSLGFVSVLTRGRSPEEYWQAAREHNPTRSSTSQRRALADWMTDVEHGAGALLARVMVNRVWHHHFGQAIVRSVGDFGVRSEPPTHPELLEWLADDFVRNGWKLKRLHRLIVLSAVYQQGSSGVAPTADPDNRLLWKLPLRRLEGEILRDAILAASGSLNDKMYGPAVKLPIAAEAMLARNLKDPYPAKIDDSDELRRRSVYLFHKRVVPYPLLQAFDKPDAQQSCSRRDRTTVAPQALALMNDPFVRQSALTFAARIRDDVGDAPARWVERGYQLAIGREPSETELASTLGFIAAQVEARAARDPGLDAGLVAQQALADFCQVLFSLNEFIYVD